MKYTNESVLSCSRAKLLLCVNNSILYAIGHRVVDNSSNAASTEGDFRSIRNRIKTIRDGLCNTCRGVLAENFLNSIYKANKATICICTCLQEIINIVQLFKSTNQRLKIANDSLNARNCATVLQTSDNLIVISIKTTCHLAESHFLNLGSVLEFLIIIVPTSPNIFHDLRQLVLEFVVLFDLVVNGFLSIFLIPLTLFII